MGEKENPPKRKMPEFDMKDEKVEEIKTVAAVTKMLAENPQIALEIADIFKDAEMEKQRKIVEGVTKLLAEKVAAVSPEQIEATFAYWYLVSSPSQWVHRNWVMSCMRP